MPKFLVNQMFQFKHQVRRENAVLVIAEADVIAEAEKGKKKIHFKGGREEERWLSGLFNYCSPADDRTADLVAKLTGEKVAVPESMEEKEKNDAEAIMAVRAEMDSLGIAYDNRWGLTKLNNEFTKAKKMRGL